MSSNSTGTYGDPGNTDWTIGAYYNNSYWFNGSIDDVRIYNRALSPSEVTALYNAGSAKFNKTPTDALTDGLVGHWTFDGKDTPWTSATAATTLDKSGNGNTGTLTNMAQATSPTIGKLGQGLKFDGGDDYVSVGNSSWISQSFSLGAWFKSNSSSYQMFVAKLAGSNRSTWQFYGGLTDTGGIVFKIYSSDGDVTYISNTNGFNNNQWHHAVITIADVDGSTNKTVNMYIDGVLYANSATPTGTPGSYGVKAANIILGARFTPALSLPHKGLLDDVRIYNRALLPTEITQLYNLGR